jgi:hypothetical protein
MSRVIRRRSGLAILFAAIAVLAVPARAAEFFRARLLTGKAPVEPPAVAIRIEIQGYTSAEELNLLAKALDQSNDAFLGVLQGLKKGVVRFMDSRGWNLDIHAAQSLPTAKGRKILCVLFRQTWDPGAQFARTGANYFMIVELNLNEKGTGEGRLYEDAGIQFRLPEGVIEMTKSGSAPKLLIQAAQVKK